MNRNERTAVAHTPLPLAPERGQRDADPLAAARLAHGKGYAFTTTIEPPNETQLAGNGNSERALPMADYECEHGRLPGDRTPDCGCWNVQGNLDTARKPSKRTGTRPAITSSEADFLKPAIAVETYEDTFFGRTLRRLDEEINRLLEARERLHELRRTDASATD